MKHILTLILSSVLALTCTTNPDKPLLTRYVNPFLGTATLWEPEDLGYVRTWKERTWGAEVFPGSSLPNAMVQLSPMMQFRSGVGYHRYRFSDNKLKRLIADMTRTNNPVKEWAIQKASDKVFTGFQDAEAHYALLMEHSANYKNLFDSSTGFIPIHRPTRNTSSPCRCLIRWSLHSVTIPLSPSERKATERRYGRSNMAINQSTDGLLHTSNLTKEKSWSSRLNSQMYNE